MKTGKLIIFSAPSGSGKTTIVKALLKRIPELEFSISATTRLPRGKEEDGVEYYFLTQESFKEKIKNNNFVEYEEVYKGSYYGTLHSELERIWKKGHHVIFDIDVKGGVNLEQQFGDQALSVFVQPPSVEELKRRLESRKTETKDKIKQRLAKAEEEIVYKTKFDKILINEDLEVAIDNAEKLVKNFLNQ